MSVCYMIYDTPIIYAIVYEFQPQFERRFSMKKKYVILLVCAGLFVLASCTLYHRSKSKSQNVMRQFFHQPQWKDIDFSKNKYNMDKVPSCISPSLSDAVYEDIVSASKEAGISDPILPQDFDRLPDGAKYHFAVIQEEIDKKRVYELRFFVLADDSDPNIIYSIWISAVPLVYEENIESRFFGNTGKEFIFSVNDDPATIRKTMIDYFSNNTTAPDTK